MAVVNEARLHSLHVLTHIAFIDCVDRYFLSEKRLAIYTCKIRKVFRTFHDDRIRTPFTELVTERLSKPRICWVKRK